ncbi:CorA family divalent cation transporter [Nocardia asteroides]|uniref:CorA family divalent cation transporter n=1 Tax=Nocardia asteroides TaxID=1824 RepID=UPI001E4A5E37|nr:CorA family divalent cation transporter [Nocardia asteroides]UGT61550.1 hypothetical protein LTT61_31300 [Nocardia asteroides]
MAVSAVSPVRFDTEVLQKHWIPLPAGDHDTAAVLRERLGVDFAEAGERIWATEDFLYVPVALDYLCAGRVQPGSVVFALGREFLVTLQPREHFPPFDAAIVEMRRRAELTASAHGVMYTLLWAMNDAAEQVVEHGGALLDALRDDIDGPGGVHYGREIAPTAVRELMARIGAAEETLSRARRAQVRLARAARQLRAEATGRSTGLRPLLDDLLDDVDGVAQQAGFEHDRVGYLQQSLRTRLDAEHTRIVKASAVLSAVLLPPILIAALYGIDASWMPELSWQHVVLATVPLSMLAVAVALAIVARRNR